MTRRLSTRCLILIFLLFTTACTNTQGLTIVRSPSPLPLNDTRLKIFLGGSIDMGQAEDWQSRLERELADSHAVVLNPRRNDWNKDWQPISTDENFRAQVEWELAALEYADVIVMYFVPNTKSPISLLEFGLYAKSGKLIVLCPEGFWRKGNVDIVSARYGVRTVATLAALIAELKALAT